MSFFDQQHAPSGFFSPSPAQPMPDEELSPEDAEILAAQAELDALAPGLWRDGDLRWKLDDHQVEIYDHFHEWHARKQTEAYALEQEQRESSLDDVYFELIARRFGKTAKWIVMLYEFAILLPRLFNACRNGAHLTYATAQQKDIGEIIVPLHLMLSADSPPQTYGEYHGTRGPLHEGIYFPNGSVIKLVGIDKHPDALRGRFSDGIVISEAREIRKLVSTMRSVLLPQFQRRRWAFLAIETSAPDDIGHDLMREVKPDAVLRRAFIERTIDANTVIDPREKAKAIRQAGGRGSVECEREYFNDIKRDENVVVVPEFEAPKEGETESRHVHAREVPEFAHCYVSMDPGMRDLCAVLWGLWDFDDALLYVQRDWAKRNASNAEIAGTIKTKEAELWGTDHDWKHPIPPQNEHPALALQRKASPMPEGLHYWSKDKKRLEQNPFRRVSDVEPRLISELNREHGLVAANADKSLGARRELAMQESAIHGVRTAFTAGQIVIDPACTTLIAHLTSARWNENRTDYERSDHFGHFDCLDALVYLWRAVSANRKANPLPPIAFGKDRDDTFILEDHEHRQQKTPQGAVSIADMVKPGGTRWRPAAKRRWGR